MANFVPVKNRVKRGFQIEEPQGKTSCGSVYAIVIDIWGTASAQEDMHGMYAPFQLHFWWLSSSK